jgi:hypothetical protein
LLRADPLALSWVKFGGEAYRQGLLDPRTIRLVEAVTNASLARTPALAPNRKPALPSADWATRQREALEDVARRSQARLWALAGSMLDFFAGRPRLRARPVLVVWRR